MTSPTDICNMALAAISNEVITNIDDSDRPARVCKLRYDPTLRALLREHEWNFSIKREVLAEDSTAPVFEYARRFALPSDLLKVCRVNGSFASEYRVEGGFLLSDDSTINLEFVAMVTDPNLFDGQFVEVFAQRMAAEISYSLTQNTTLTENAWRVYNDKLRMARTMDSRDGKPRDIEADAWLLARI